jgi:hypothetical protein
MASGWMGLDWGNVPTWIGTVVTSTSVAIAAISYRRSVHDKERSQASLVAGWIGITTDGGQLRRVLRISNGSDTSIYDVTARIPSIREITLPELPAKTTTSVDIVVPQTAAMKRVEISINLWVLAGSAVRETVSQDLSPELEFRDGSGRLWKRSPDGRLTQLRERTFTYSEAKLGGLFGLLLGERPRTDTSASPQSGRDTTLPGE